MIQNLSIHTPARATTTARTSSPKAPVHHQQAVSDTVSISSNTAPAKSSGWLSGLKKTAMMAGLAACLAGPLAGTASAQSFCQPYPHYPQRPVVVQVVRPQHRHHHQNQVGVGISIGPGGVHIQAGVQQHNPWGHRHPAQVMPLPCGPGMGMPQVMPLPGGVIVQPQPTVIYQQQQVIVQQPPQVIYQQAPWGY